MSTQKRGNMKEEGILTVTKNEKADEREREKLGMTG